MHKIFKIFLSVILIFNCCACTNTNVVEDENDAEIKKLETLNISFLKVGKADAIVISQAKNAILIDTGEDDDAKRIINHLQQNGIENIEALIITHFDKDHVGAADKIIDQYPVKNIYVPDYIGHHSEYFEFLDSVIRNHLELTKITDDFKFQFADAELLIEATKLFENNDTSYDNDNNHSLITSLKHGQNKFLFMADAEKERLNEWLNQDNNETYDLIKMPHHGIYDESLIDLLKSTEVKYAIITDSKKNSADKKTIELLYQEKISFFSTQNKNINAISDGQKIDIFYN